MNEPLRFNTSVSYLEKYKDTIDFEAIEKEAHYRQKYLFRKDTGPMREAVNFLSDLQAKNKDYSSDTVTIGAAGEVDATTREQLKQALEKFIPWRKGPFSVFGIDIDAEWRSNLKWNRFAQYIDPLKDKRIVDIGANNGYYMFKMAYSEPELVLGIDPTHRYRYTFEALNLMANEHNLHYELFGFEQLPLFENFFDIAFNMGIVYHHSDPITILKNTAKCLKPGGQLILESMGIPGDEPVCLFPNKRYMNIPGTWFLPTAAALENWLIRAGFTDIQCIFNERLYETEQRKTEWSPYRSLKEQLHPENNELTVEGYIRPDRIYFTARKK